VAAGTCWRPRVLDCYSGGTAGGPLAAARPGTLFTDCSAIELNDARAAHRPAVAAGGKDFSAIITDIHALSGYPGEPHPQEASA
jgi:hypothetical protein